MAVQRSSRRVLLAVARYFFGLLSGLCAFPEPPTITLGSSVTVGPPPSVTLALNVEQLPPPVEWVGDDGFGPPAVPLITVDPKGLLLPKEYEKLCWPMAVLPLKVTAVLPATQINPSEVDTVWL